MKAHNPTPNYFETMAQLAIEAEEVISKALKGQKGEYSALPTAHDLNPWDSATAYGDAYR